jgi:nucleotide-binding universal stress UspA family protein
VTAHPRLPVLVGVDDALLTVRVGTVEARLRGLPLHLVCAFDAPPPQVLPEAPWPPRDAARSRMMRATNAVAAAHPAIDLDARMVRGDLAELLVARSRHVSLVVIARGALARHSGGASAHRVASRSTVPVVVVPPQPAPPGGPVVVGLAGGAASGALLAYAFEEAALRGVPLRAVHVNSEMPDRRWGRFDPIVGLATDAPPVATAPAEDAERLLAEALAGWPAKYPDVDIERRAVHGPDVEHGIAALTRDASMVVVAARSRLETGERVLGPITTGLLRDSECPVVVIPAADPVFTG